MKGTEGIDFSFAPVDADRSRVLTKEQVDSYNRNGYLFPLQALKADEVLPIRSYVDSLMERLAALDDGRDNYALRGYHTCCEGLYDLAMNPRVLDVVQDILGPNIVCWSSHLFCKIARDKKRTPLHQDAPYWRLTPARTVTAWIAIDSSQIENSCMQVIPGTHTRGEIPFETVEGDVVLNLEIPGGLAADSVPVELNAGDFSIHSDLTAHWSAANSSGKRRCGFAIRYCPPSVTPIDRSFGANALLCRGEGADHWTFHDKPRGDHLDLMAFLFEKRRARSKNK